MELATEEPLEVDLISYSISVVPPENSTVVVEEKEKLLGSIDLRALVTDLGRVGSFIRIAYNGVGAAGPKHTDNQIEIQRLGYDITKLCDKSAVTVAKFKSASKIVITDLQASYGFLLDGLDQLAVETLANIKKVAAGMKEAALELHKDFEKQADKVVITLETTQRSKKDEALEIERLKKERVELEEKRKRANEKAEEAASKAREAEAKQREYEMKEDETISRIGEEDVLHTLVNAFTTKIGIGPVLSGKDYKGQAEEFKKKKIEALEALNEAQKEKSKQLDDMASFAAKLTNCAADANMAEVAVDALHEAIGALKQLSAVMMQAALFWTQMEQHCQALSEDAMSTIVETSMKYPDTTRLKIWTGNTFKRRAMQFYAGWVALHSVCGIYMEYIKMTQKDLYKYLQENPTYEESRVNVKELAKIFLEDVQKEQKALSDKEFASAEEIHQLTAEYEESQEEK